ncbi:hypothetical protein LguiB_007670 [Lonicera macranthoides]
MLHCLRDDAPQRLSKFLLSGILVATLKKRIQKFNTLFEGVRSTQSRWSVEYWRLREELSRSMVDTLVPAYKSFLERYNSCIGTRNSEDTNEGAAAIISDTIAVKEEALEKKPAFIIDPFE